MKQQAKNLVETGTLIKFNKKKILKIVTSNWEPCWEKSLSYEELWTHFWHQKEILTTNSDFYLVKKIFKNSKYPSYTLLYLYNINHGYFCTFTTSSHTKKPFEIL